jgi:hypothetical protein
MEVWFTAVPHWLVPVCPSSVVGGRFDGRYVALYIWSALRVERTDRIIKSAKNIVEGGGG